ncbi:helix-turn-helix domain-containing protein [Massilia sp. SYSU DXS3249]
MRTTLDFLNEVVAKHRAEITSDSALARFLGVTRQAIHQYKQGQNMSVLVALKVAKILGIHPMETVAATLHAQAATEEERNFWLQVYQEHGR